MKKILLIISILLGALSLSIFTSITYAGTTLPGGDGGTPSGGGDAGSSSTVDSAGGNTNNGGGESTCVKLNTDFPGVGKCIDANNASGAFSGMMGALMKLLVNITIAVAFIALIAAGVMMTTSGISQNTAGKGKELLKKVILGIVLLGMSGLILHVINPNFFKTGLTTQLIKKL